MDKRISTGNIGIEFDKHLSLNDNERIIFSGKFGSGKTTFLNDFFNQEGYKNYHVIKLYPIHYSISSNEDIFEYIKFDILFQLLSQNVECNATTYSDKELLPEYIATNLYPILGKFIKVIPYIGKHINDLASIWKELKKGYQAFKAKKNDNELSQTMNFLKSFINDSIGNPYERNQLSTIINYMLDNIKKNNSSSRNVLLIDDFDRIDPEHTFRLLNIFSSQCDNQFIAGEKFVFDHIIFVCDINNIRNIFHHKYGSETDFTGYIDKFYSKQIFKFDIRKEFIEELNIFLSPLRTSRYINDMAWEFITPIIEELINRGEINLRTAHRFSTIKIQPYSYTIRDAVMRYSNVAVSVFNVLSAILGEDDLERIINKYDSMSLMYSIYSPLAYSAGVLFDIISHEKFKFNINKDSFFDCKIGDYKYTSKPFSDVSNRGYVLRIHFITNAKTNTDVQFFPFWEVVKKAFYIRKRYIISGYRH